MSADDDLTRELLEENRKLRQKLEAQQSGEADIDRSDMPDANSDLVDRHIAEKDFTPSTADTKRRFVRRITEWSGGTHLADMTKDDLLNWVNQTDAKEGGKYSYLGSLKNIYEWMESKGWVNENPALEARETGGFEAESNTTTGLGSDAIDPRLSEAQARSVVSQIVHMRDRTIFVIGFKTGLRAQSIRMLRYEDIDLETKTIVDRHPKDHGNDPENPARGNKKVVLPIDDETATALREWFEIRPESKWVFPGQAEGDCLSDTQIRRAVNKTTDDLAKRTDGELAAKLSAFTSHKFRKSFVKHMRKSGCDDYIIQRLRGDKDEGMTDTYDDRDREEIREEYEDHVMKFSREE